MAPAMTPEGIVGLEQDRGVAPPVPGGVPV